MEIKFSEITKEKGLFTNKSFKKGEIVYTLSGKIFDAPTRESIHIGNNQHIYDEYGIYINHSFNPNVIVKGAEFIACSDINSGDELFFNYNESEMKMSNPFYIGDKLVCGSKSE